jgi:hypothetical protein
MVNRLRLCGMFLVCPSQRPSGPQLCILANAYDSLPISVATAVVRRHIKGLCAMYAYQTCISHLHQCHFVSLGSLPPPVSLIVLSFKRIVEGRWAGDFCSDTTPEAIPMQDNFTVTLDSYGFFLGQGTRKWNPYSRPQSFQIRLGAHSGANPKTGYVWETYGGGFDVVTCIGRLSNRNNTLSGTWKIVNGDRRLKGTFSYRRMTASIPSSL